jgi:hypothetical protein
LGPNFFVGFLGGKMSLPIKVYLVVFVPCTIFFMEELIRWAYTGGVSILDPYISLMGIIGSITLVLTALFAWKKEKTNGRN